MSEQENPLPKPPKTPFGGRRTGEHEEGPQQPLMADRMAMAMAEGRLDAFMRENLPDNEQTRQLAMMMMSMTGMMPPAGFSLPDKQQHAETLPDRKEEEGQNTDCESAVPEDVLRAVQSGDMHQLMELLRREHGKRSGSEIPLPTAADAGSCAAPSEIEKEVLDEMLEIAAANNLTLDWLIMRAMKVYIGEYRKSGRL